MKRKLTALILSMTLILSSTFAFSGCGMNTRFAMSINGEEVAAGVYIISQYYATAEARSKFSEEYPDEDTSVDGWKPDDYLLEGVKYTEWIDNRAVEMVARFYAIEEMYKERDLSFTRDELAEINSTIEQRWNTNKQMEELYAMLGEQALQFDVGGDTWGEFFEKAGASKESYKFILTNDEKTAALFESIYGAEGTDPVPEEEWRPYFIENYTRVRVVQMSFVDEEDEPYEQERIDDLREFALKQFEKVEDGGNFYAARQAYYEYLYGIDNSDDNVYDLDLDDIDFDDDLDDISDDDNNDENADEGDDNNDDEDDDNDENADEDDDNNEDDDDDNDEGDDNDEDEGDDNDEDENDDNIFEDLFDEDELSDYMDELDYGIEEYLKVTDYPDNEIIIKLSEMDFDIPEFFEGENAFYILLKLDVTEREDKLLEYRDEVTVELRAEEFDDMLNQKAKEWITDGTVVLNQKALNRYDARKFL
ncbi:MAG: hypothetical protein FWF94_04070 [Oscillospiraceae bacterium]|nr:hypothetical protein [Oscillospiraceae bacterium]